MPEAVSVRAFAAGDEASLRRIWHDAVDDGSLPGTEHTKIDLLVDRLRVGPSGFYVAALAGRVTGLLHIDAHMIVVERTHRRTGIGRALVAHASSDPACDRLLLWLPDGNDGARRFYEALGMSYQMSFWELALHPEAVMNEPTFPAELELCPFDQVDIEDYVSLFNTAFAEHPTPARLTPELVAWAHSLPGFDPTLVLVLRERTSGELVGFCRVGLDRNHSEQGEVKFIGLLPAWRGRGLGRKLLAWGVLRARRAGAGRITLTVEGENASAIALYERSGFVATREWRRYGHPES